ncbi:MAG: response regulator [Bacteroidales bacterium]|nr:response regulator [Bacteroidales bacterium]
MIKEENNSIQVMLIDDHPIVLNGIKNLLAGVQTIESVTEASNGKDALLLLENNNNVDLVITDISMPEMDGIELTQIVKNKYPNIKVLILTVHNERGILKEALFSGAEGCLLKNTSKKELLQAIHKIMDNGYYYCDEILTIARDINKEEQSVVDEPSSLSKRELEVLELILQGYSNKEIAEKLSISYHTVCSHRKNTMKKTGSNNISGLFSYAKKYNLFTSLFEDNGI